MANGLLNALWTKGNIVLDQTLCLIREFQTLIVGTIGFVGVIFTIYKNSAIAREQTETVQHHAREAFRSAIYSELETIKGIFRGRVNDLQKVEENGILLPDSISTSVFDSLQPQIGILDIDEISQIIKTYLTIKELPMRLNVLSVESGSSGMYDGYIFINNKHVKHAGTMHENFIETIDEALNVIKL